MPENSRNNNAVSVLTVQQGSRPAPSQASGWLPGQTPDPFPESPFSSRPPAALAPPPGPLRVTFITTSCPASAAIGPRQGSCAPSEVPRTLRCPRGPVKSQRGAPSKRKGTHQVCDKLHLQGSSLCSVGSLDSKARSIGSKLGEPFPQTEGPSHTASEDRGPGRGGHWSVVGTGE